MPVKHTPHVCYSCSCTILKDQEETRIEGLKAETTIRYKHATDAGCRDALNRQVSYGSVFSEYRDPEDDAENMYQGRHRST
jgi:hypothetical protein